MSAPGYTPVSLDLTASRRRGGRHFWRSLDEYGQSPAFLEYLHREFPERAAEWNDPEGRREFLKVMGASLALAGFGAACTRQPEEKIVPYVKAPEEIIPGRPLFFATAVTHRGYARGVLAESHMGRPTKLEGNPEHPESLGATDIFTQAAILGLYDPDRTRTLSLMGETRAWPEFVGVVRTAMENQKRKQGAGFRLLTGNVTSPSLKAQIDGLLAEYPRALWHVWEPAVNDNARNGAVAAFGEPVSTRVRFDKAAVIVCLDADFISDGPSNVRLIREFASRRKVAGPGHGEQQAAEPVASMNRLYVVETSPTLAGAVADHRLPIRPSELAGVARALGAAVGVGGEGGTTTHHAWVGAVARDLQRSAGASVVIAGESAPAAVHALAHAINERLGNVGQTVTYSAPIEAHPETNLESLEALVVDLKAGRCDLLVIVDCNPVYTAPVDLGFAEAMGKVFMRVHVGLHDDETSELCHWHVPMAHPLETWSDARSADGTVTLIQPLIAPLYGGRSAHEIVTLFAKGQDRPGHDLLKEHWQPVFGEAGFEAAWRQALHDGIVPGSAAAAKVVLVRPEAWSSAAAEGSAALSHGAPDPGGAGSGGLEIAFRMDPSVDDGRYANNGWLQELPKSLTKLTWDNAALMSPKTARKLGIRDTTFDPANLSDTGTTADVVKIGFKGRSVTAPAWVVPGHPDDVITVNLGYGRTRAGRVGNGLGFDAYALRTSDALWSGDGVEVRKTGATFKLACTQTHWNMEGRHLVRTATLQEFTRNPGLIHEMGHAPKRDESLFPSFEYKGHAWGMTIDLGACVGCNACVTACVAENNIPVVGKDQVSRGREMHWIRVDRYYEGDDATDSANVGTYQQPILCMHCENAPCEQVCPVAATVHSDEGLNDMVYNRCVGTRYCSNNCPYKVRRFNFYLYQDWNTPTYKLMRNPDVTVRSRGVMEKCTYCVQRINAARIDAKNEGRAIRDGEIKTACQQACPAEAIVFGDVNDPNSRVSTLKVGARNYDLLAELNTRPRTSYLASLCNPNPELEASRPSPEPRHG